MFRCFGKCSSKKKKILKQKKNEIIGRYYEELTEDEILDRIQIPKYIFFTSKFETNNYFYQVSNFSTLTIEKYKKRMMLIPLKEDEIEDINKDNGEQICCPICCEEIKKNQNIVRLDVCNHQFHDLCAIDFLNHKEECPICRKNISSDIEVITKMKNKSENTYSVSSYESD